ncbi:alpha/beta hydrolase [Kineococcus rhizosphaerae]|uniref:Carboxylesterase n=1 Tax=Kineococcus rhizosphaerae TaxID=559628 RepID=A0A2T0R4Z1_9ACTN|nr:alpha/beta fold hydrolase [Kineococcus rhizosphaerae]PRY15842.1 carboxylesterase [Kineococcus rhizosphaerae]
MTLAERTPDERVRGFSRRHAGRPRTGVLVLHGFTATPLSVAGWAEEFHAAGFDVEVPLLPGHGTTVADCDRSTWDDWLSAAGAALDRLGNEVVLVAGISMGGCLALRLAELRPGRVHGLVLANPAVGLAPWKELVVATLGRVLPGWPAIAGDLNDPGAEVLAYDRTPLRALVSQSSGWRRTREDLALVHQPLLLLRSRVDHVVPALSSKLVLAGVSSDDVTEVVYANSFHELTSDRDAPAVFAASVRFARRLAHPSEPAR